MILDGSFLGGKANIDMERTQFKFDLEVGSALFESACACLCSVCMCVYVCMSVYVCMYACVCVHFGLYMKIRLHSHCFPIF
jgi:hypothetical protein